MEENYDDKFFKTHAFGDEATSSCSLWFEAVDLCLGTPYTNHPSVERLNVVDATVAAILVKSWLLCPPSRPWKRKRADVQPSAVPHNLGGGGEGGGEGSEAFAPDPADPEIDTRASLIGKRKDTQIKTLLDPWYTLHGARVVGGLSVVSRLCLAGVHASCAWVGSWTSHVDRSDASELQHCDGSGLVLRYPQSPPQDWVWGRTRRRGTVSSESRDHLLQDRSSTRGRAGPQCQMRQSAPSNVGRVWGEFRVKHSSVPTAVSSLRRGDSPQRSGTSRRKHGCLEEAPWEPRPTTVVY